MNIAPKKLTFSLVATAMACISTYAAPPSGPPPPEPNILPPGFPIDGNILLLFFAATFYGIYILKKFKFQSK